MDIIFPLSRQNPKPFFIGIMKKARIIPISPGQQYLGIAFKPGIAPPLLGIPANQLADVHLPLERLNKKLADTLTPDDPLKSIKSLLHHFDTELKNLIQNCRFDQRVQKAVSRIQAASGKISLDRTARDLDLSLRQLQRLFSLSVGLSPKKFATISRFLSIHRAMSQRGLSDLIFLALEFNYYDQSHFNREYKRITGLTPTSEVMSCFYKT